ncbi:hypothetical protein [Cellulomonas sp.]|uniref:hypothetical protein n=1 Tax=Cellulomonas sp. TaxID=40001 RepID=UPI001B00C76E|nr:hypothetical protein [Cellulomonas sp.]MBO9553569.1 hypothetical protein [Cellulomonas sp.]
MPNPVTSSPARVPVALTALTAALAVAFVVAPRTLAASGAQAYAGSAELTASARSAFVEYWTAGVAGFTPALDGVVGYWSRYHLAKAAIAAGLLAVLVALGARTWQAFARPGRRAAARWALAAAGVAVTVLGVFSGAVVLANVQGAVVPFASLLPMAVSDGGVSDGGVADGGLAETVRTSLADGRTSPALDAMIGDFARFHLVLAVLAAVVVAVLVVSSVVLWRRRAATLDVRARRVLATFGVLWAVLAAGVGVLALANASTAADPAPAFQAFVDGGW